jgi:outer membrane lipoprotein-sorting protein
VHNAAALNHLRYAFIVLVMTLPARCLPGAELLPAVERWLEGQAEVRTWSADFIQTRHLKSLTQPLKAGGRVWFAAPNNFRWELGTPAKTIALRATNEMLLIYPGLKIVERYPLDAREGPWRDASALLEAGFPRSRSDLDRQFEVVSQRKTEADGVVELALRPKSAASRKMMPRITLTIDTTHGRLAATELEFADGSRMRNDFSNQQVNQPVPESSFSTAIPEGYRLVEPAKGAR